MVRIFLPFAARYLCHSGLFTSQNIPFKICFVFSFNTEFTLYALVYNTKNFCFFKKGSTSHSKDGWGTFQREGIKQKPTSNSYLWLTWTTDKNIMGINLFPFFCKSDAFCIVWCEISYPSSQCYLWLDFPSIFLFYYYWVTRWTLWHTSATLRKCHCSRH